MSWYVTEYGGKKTAPFELDGVFRYQMDAMFIHGYATRQEAEAHPQTINALQWGAVEDIRAQSSIAHPTSIPRNVVTAGADATLGSVFGGVTSSSFWVRVGETLAGFILLAVGVNGLVKGTPANQVVKTTGKVSGAAVSAAKNAKKFMVAE